MTFEIRIDELQRDLLVAALRRAKTDTVPLLREPLNELQGMLEEAKPGVLNDFTL